MTERGAAVTHYWNSPADATAPAALVPRAQLEEGLAARGATTDFAERLNTVTHRLANDYATASDRAASIALYNDTQGAVAQHHDDILYNLHYTLFLPATRANDRQSYACPTGYERVLERSECPSHMDRDTNLMGRFGAWGGDVTGAHLPQGCYVDLVHGRTYFNTRGHDNPKPDAQYLPLCKRSR